MKNSFIYNTFREIVDQFEVYIVRVSNQQYQFKLIKKPEHPREPKVTLKDVIERIDKLDEKLTTRIDNIVVKNNLVE